MKRNLSFIFQCPRLDETAHGKGKVFHMSQLQDQTTARTDSHSCLWLLGPIRSEVRSELITTASVRAMHVPGLKDKCQRLANM